MFVVLSFAACGGRAAQNAGDEGPGESSGGGRTSGNATAGGRSDGAGGIASTGGAASGSTTAGADGLPTGGRAAGVGGVTGIGGLTLGGEGGAAAGRTSVAGAAGMNTGGALLSDACTAPPEPGTCDLDVWQFRHDPALGLCVPHYFNVCDSSANRYATRDECLAACNGGEPDLDACAGFEDCLVTSLGCCGPCDPVDAGLLVAVNSGRIAQLRELTDCGDVQCEQCLPVAPNEQTMKYLYGACVQGQCTVRDLRNSPAADCDIAADCTLRCGASCCPNCTAAAGVVAYRADAELTAELCGDVLSACDDCSCEIPPEYAAECVEGRCIAVIGPVCEFGVDQSCNASSLMSSIAGTCNPDGTCTCNAWIDPATGRCE